MKKKTKKDKTLEIPSLRTPEELEKVTSLLCKKVEQTFYSINKDCKDELGTTITYNDIILSLSRLIALYSFYLRIEEEGLTGILNNIAFMYNKLKSSIDRDKFIENIASKQTPEKDLTNQ